MNNSIEMLVEKFIRKYGTRDPFILAKTLNIEVQFGNPGCEGCYMFLKNHRYIFLNQNLNEYEMITVMAHELGHAIMHRRQNCYFIRNKTFLSNSKTEQEANRFAAALLIADEIILENKDMTTEMLSRLTGYNQYIIELKFQSIINRNLVKKKN